MSTISLCGPRVRLIVSRHIVKYQSRTLRFLSSSPPKVKSELHRGDEGAGKHMKFTAYQRRQPFTVQASVTDVRLESPTVKGITLKINDTPFNFKAGQWVDMFIPGIETVGGFSIYSSPNQLAETGTLDLGIKFSTWPPANWIHSECKAGSTVALRVGGEFYYSPKKGDGSNDLLLIAGGVGINPLASMYFHADHLFKLYEGDDKEYCPGKVLLLYSAKTYEDILYKDHLDTIMESQQKMDVKYFTTREHLPASNAKYGHIDMEVLKSALQNLNTSTLKSFICGPPPMIEDMKKHLLACGLARHQVLYEKWW